MNTFHHSTGAHAEVAGSQHDAQAQRQAQAIGIIHTMGERLSQYLHLVDLPAEHLPALFFLREAHGRPHRVVLINAEGIRNATELTFVAFFGEKRAHADHESLDALDNEFIREFRAYPHLLSYSSLQLPDSNWANLVLMSSPEGIDRWAESQRHAHAAQHVAPTCYTGIHLYRGSIQGGLGPDNTVAVARTKRFAF